MRTTHSTGPTATSSYGTCGISGTERANLCSIGTDIGMYASYEMTPGKPVHGIHSKEGTIQSNVFGASNYAVAMLPLEEKMRREIPNTLQPCFADDSTSGGAVKTMMPA